MATEADFGGAEKSEADFGGAEQSELGPEADLEARTPWSTALAAAELDVFDLIRATQKARAAEAATRDAHLAAEAQSRQLAIESQTATSEADRHRPGIFADIYQDEAGETTKMMARPMPGASHLVTNFEDKILPHNTPVLEAGAVYRKDAEDLIATWMQNMATQPPGREPATPLPAGRGREMARHLAQKIGDSRPDYLLIFAATMATPTEFEQIVLVPNTEEWRHLRRRVHEGLIEVIKAGGDLDGLNRAVAELNRKNGPSAPQIDIRPGQVPATATTPALDGAADPQLSLFHLVEMVLDPAMPAGAWIYVAVHQVHSLAFYLVTSILRVGVAPAERAGPFDINIVDLKFLDDCVLRLKQLMEYTTQDLAREPVPLTPEEREQDLLEPLPQIYHTLCL